MNVKLLTNLDFAKKINECNAVSEAGKEMLNNYRGYVYSNPVSCGVVNSFVTEAQKYGFDTGLNSILESVLGFINENKISWKLASACESITNNPSTYNYIAKIGVGQVEKLLEMNENDVVAYIKAGGLKSVQYIPEFRNVCKEVYKTNINEVHAVNYSLKTPVSYVMIGENKEQYFSILGKTYKKVDDKIEEGVCSDVTFNRINMLLESFSLDENENLYYEYKGVHGDVCRFTINEESLDFTKGDIKESFENKISFMEYCNKVSVAMQMNEKMNFMNVTSAIAEVFECVDSIVALDNAKLMTTANGTVAAIIEGKDNVNLTVFRSYGAGSSCNSYDYMCEALKEVTKLTGIDLKATYENRINEDVKKQDPSSYESIQEELKANKDAQMELRKKKIAMLAEQYKNNPAIIAVLNKAARDLAILD